MPAKAFEKQWHFGGGLGAATANHHALGPALNLYAAYGLSDVFDARVEAFGSRHEPLLSFAALKTAVERGESLEREEPEASFIYGAKLALAYKVDIIEWIPYLGVTGGLLGVIGGARPAPSPGETPLLEPSPFRRVQPSVGGMFGLDYVVSRAFGLGVCFTGEYAGHAGATYFTGFVRGEYRLGW